MDAMIMAASIFSYSKFKRLVRDERGATAAEFGLVALVFVSLIIGSIDLSRQIWEVNTTKTAVREAARLAAVNEMASVWLQNLDPITSGLVAGNGDPVPAGSIALVTCSGATNTCTGAGVTNTAINATVMNALLAKMRAFNPRIRLSNIRVSYRHVGLGFAGNPFGPDVEPEISVWLEGFTLTPGPLRLISNSATIPLPKMISTVTAEDMS
jgi:Flp pilus assembly pilin Flp